MENFINDSLSAQQSKYKYFSNVNRTTVQAKFDLFASEYLLKHNALEYSSVKYFSSDTRKILSQFGMSEMNISKFLYLVCEEINKFDFSVNYRGIRYGYFDYHALNLIEEYALKNDIINSLYDHNYLFEYENKEKSILEIKVALSKRIKLNKTIEHFKRGVINDLSFRFLRPMIMDINGKLDAQLVMKNGTIVPEDTYICEDDLKKIYIKIKNNLVKYADTIFFNAYWKSLNQRVLSRYK